MTANASDNMSYVSPQRKPSSAQDSDNMALTDSRALSNAQSATMNANNNPFDGAHDGQKSTSAPTNPKDPARPKRKKAKRACFACQRGHLTCGDERPCQRCIKRGVQDACHDGVRKKAKYLHDAPNEALMPNIGGPVYNQRHANRNSISQSINGVSQSPKSLQQNTSPPFFASQQTPEFGNYAQPTSEGPMVQTQQLQDSAVHSDAFASQSPVSPTFRVPPNVHNKNFSAPLSQSSNATPTAPGQGQTQFGPAFFDPSDPALFNFDIASMNFGNHYGALEFGMLGHMATGVGDTPPSDTATQRGSMGRSGSGTFGIAGASNFGESPTNQPFLFGETGVNDWTQSTPVNTRNLYGQQNMVGGGMPDKPHAFAIESAPANFASPKSSESPLMTTTTTATAFDDNGAPAFNSRHTMAGIAPQRQQPPVSTSQLKQQGFHLGHKRRHRKPSAIYDSVKEPYSYTSGFHSLTAFIQRRFTPQKTLRIAKALASIRPSFIATTKTLNRDDLIFMEKCFQRTLWEYEDFINACGTPTIVCRRTGEIAAVGKEFSILTGWKKEVLLGKEPNLNANTGGSSGSVTGTTSRGSYTPRAGANLDNQNALGAPRTQPVFLAELLDDDSVVEFYEDFAKLAFGDSRGSVMTTCKLLKYKTKEDTEVIPSGNGEDSISPGDSPPASNGEGLNGYNNGTSNGSNGNGAIDRTVSNGQQQPNSRQKWGKGGIAGEAGMNQLGFRDGKVECSYCWTVKRDVFDIPMLIVMNTLPFFASSLTDATNRRTGQEEKHPNNQIITYLSRPFKMCLKAECNVCTKSNASHNPTPGSQTTEQKMWTWLGCGQHIPSVMDSIPKDEWCKCTPKRKVGDTEYPPKLGEGKAAS